MFSREQMQRAIEDALKQMEGVALELYRRGREEAREELERVTRERDELVAQRARMAEQIATLDRNAETFFEDAGRMRRERDKARASVADAYRRGAEAMRDAAANALDMAGQGTLCDTSACDHWGRYVRALPIPEEP